MKVRSAEKPMHAVIGAHIDLRNLKKRYREKFAIMASGERVYWCQLQACTVRVESNVKQCATCSATTYVVRSYLQIRKV